VLKKNRNFDVVSERKELEKSLMQTLYC